MPDLPKLFAEWDAEEAAKKDAISHRNVLLGLATIAAPAIIRTPGLLMPVRYRPQMYDKYGLRNWKDFPPTLDEFRAYERCRDGRNRQGIMVSFSAAGFNEIAAMIDARECFEAMGLL